MKTLKSVVLVALLSGLIGLSCSSDDSNPEPQTNDQIELTLTTSANAYRNANAGSWVAITETEYNLLATTLNDVTKSGATDTNYNYNTPILPVGAGDDGITMANNNGANMPTNSYLFAFKYHVTEDDVASTKVKISNVNAQNGFNNVGTALPMHDAGDHYFALKRNNAPTTNSAFLAVFCPKKMGYKVIDVFTNYHFSQSDASDLPVTGFTNSALILYQGLSTTDKQWD